MLTYIYIHYVHCIILNICLFSTIYTYACVWGEGECMWISARVSLSVRVGACVCVSLGVHVSMGVHISVGVRVSVCNTDLVMCICNSVRTARKKIFFIQKLFL